MNESFSLVPKSLDEAMKYSEMLASSNMIPKDYKGRAMDILVAIQYGLELGIKPLNALQNVAVINGRPTIWGDALLGLIQNHHEYEDGNEWIEGEGDNAKAHCMLKRRGRTAQTRSFSVEQAKRAGLWGKAGTWIQYPLRMLQLRARSFCARDVYADVLKGFITTEEAKDIPPEKDMGEATIIETPISASRTENLKAKLGIESPIPQPKEASPIIENPEEPKMMSEDLLKIKELVSNAKEVMDLNEPQRFLKQLNDEDKKIAQAEILAKRKELMNLT